MGSAAPLELREGTVAIVARVDLVRVRVRVRVKVRVRVRGRGRARARVARARGSWRAIS